MPAPAALLVFATLCPLAAFVLLLGLGRRLGTPLAGWSATFFSLLSFAASLLALVIWCNPGGRHFHGTTWGIREGPIYLTMAWLPIGPGIAQEHGGFADVGIYVDSLTIAMFAMATLVAAAASAFATGSMRRDADNPRFFLIHALLCFSIFAIFIASSILQIALFWCFAGLGVFLMVGFWNGATAARQASTRTFCILAASDALLLIGISLLIASAGNLSFPQLWASVGMLGSSHVTIAGIFISLGALGRAGQFPFHPWWTDATEAPSPAGVTLHSAGIAACGVYLLARIFPILTADVHLLLAITGTVTVVLSALIAVAQSDIRRALAYIVLAQIGYMVLGIGVGSWAGALFHLITCGFIGSLLLLAGGAVIWSADHQRDLRRFGGLWKRMPVTASTFAVGVLSMAGFPFFAAHSSRMLILADTAAFATLATNTFERSGMYWALFVLPAMSSCLIAFALVRCWMLTFVGRPRNRKIHQKAVEISTLWTPLLLLAVISIFAGSLLGVADLLAGSIKESNIQMQMIARQAGIAPLSQTTGGFNNAWPMAATGAASAGDAADVSINLSPAAFAQSHGQALARGWEMWTWMIGCVPAAILYRRGLKIARRLRRNRIARALGIWLGNEMYFVETYEWLLGRTTIAMAHLFLWFERFIIEPLTSRLAEMLRRVFA
ncbi:MAG TPA: proton-conducting transporter membrane subunit [Humisphaera sp.]|jgi:NADH-quinone oxidoreductase subunit L|nr:proton-conducting transporter membrane subunit [Humisphaera sp.]